MLAKIVEKVLGGRFILTVVCAMTFAYGVVTRYISAEVAVPVILLVFQWYFKREDRKPESNGNGTH